MKQRELFPEIALEPGSPFVGKIEEAIKKDGLMAAVAKLNLNYIRTCGQLRDWFPEKWETKLSYKQYFLARDKESEPINDI